MTMLSFIKTGESVTVYLDGEATTVDSSHPNYLKLLDALRSKDIADIKANMDIGSAVKAYVGTGRAYLMNGVVYYDDAPVQGVIVDRIMTMMTEGFDVQPMLNFLAKVYDNPSNSAIEETYLFMEHNDLTLHEDGDLIAYKGVTEDYKDCHTKKIDNRVGCEVSMDRRKVDDRRHVTCSHGLHVASLEYALGFGSKTVVVKVNPRDIVSIPNDYHNQKARVCRYVVVDELKSNQRYSDKSVVSDDELGRESNDDGDEYEVEEVTVKYHNKRDALGRFTN